MSAGLPARAWRAARNAWDRAVVYLPIVLMAVLALASYWLVRMAP